MARRKSKKKGKKITSKWSLRMRKVGGKRRQVRVRKFRGKEQVRVVKKKKAVRRRRKRR